MASIFGELITLIESSKRAGASEALSTTLPYSGRDGGSFSVPDNLYLIGTMNTADRSLARVDTALRRRFSFIPLYPDPSRLRDVEVEGIVLERLLTTINDRIEYLYDRDHLIGHAFFMDLVEDPARRTLARLAEIFDQKVIPLLEEYFFEDWRKIRWILGDDRKPERQHQFILEEPFPDLMPLDDRDTAGKPPMRYRRNDAALRHVESYRQIYAPLT
jgi:5-methylcytosine-specific restriction protein B